MVLKQRIVRCPECKQLLRELAGYDVYKCGGCGTVLQGKKESVAARNSESSQVARKGRGVFLSFCGEDIRSGFIDKLEKALNDKGIHTFGDDLELFSSSHFKGIEDTRIAIVVFSKNYASSTWCLDELSYIIDCRKKRNHQWVLPIYYDVDPSDVRHQKGPYGKAFIRHEESFKDNMEKVLKWKDALRQVSHLPCWDFTQEKEPEYKVIGKIVEQVSKKLDRICLITNVVQILWRVYANDKTWRIVGLVSSVVGLLCCALSPSFNRLIKGWNAFKISLYVVLSLAIFITIIVARQSSQSRMYVLQKVVGFVVFLVIAVCTIYYDKAVNDKPEILSVVSNAAFALMSLCLSKLAKFSHEMGVFTAFLACFAIQLWTINWMLISVAIAYGCPLFVMHYSPDSRQEVISDSSTNTEEEVISDSSTDIEQEVISEGQVVHSSTDIRQEVISECQGVHSSSDTREDQYVINIDEN